MSRRSWVTMQLYTDGEMPDDDSFTIKLDRGMWTAGDAEVTIGMESFAMHTEVAFAGYAWQIVKVAVAILHTLDIQGGHPLPNRPHESYPTLSDGCLSELSEYLRQVRVYDERLTADLMDDDE